MTDDLVKRHVEQLRLTGGDLADLCHPLADAIEALTAELQVSNELGKALEEDAGQLREENAKLTADKRFILEERDRTFALMLARAEKAEADNARYLAALNQIRLAFAGHVSVQSAIDMIDRAALKGETP